MTTTNPDSVNNAFLEKFSAGTIVEVYVAELIFPSQVITTFEYGFAGRLSLLDMSWCLPEAEQRFGELKKGELIRCVVLSIDGSNQQVRLSQKHFLPPFSDTIAWERINRGDEYSAQIISKFNNTCLVRTAEGIYGLLPKRAELEPYGELRVRIADKLTEANLMRFISVAEDEQTITRPSDVSPEFNFIEEELVSYAAFNQSILGNNAADEDHEVIKAGFERDPRIFSREVAAGYPLYIQFENNSNAWEGNFKQQAIPYFFSGEAYQADTEKKLLTKLNTQHYWFKLNKRGGDWKDAALEFSLYNDDINIFGQVIPSKDNREVRFLIKNLNVGHSFSVASEKKKTYSKAGSFLYTSPVTLLSPLDNLPLNDAQRQVLDYLMLKTECFERLDKARKASGEILRKEGHTLRIIDKFLEYQIKLLSDRKEYNAFVESHKQIPSETGGISITIPASSGDMLETEGDTVVNLRLKQPSLKIDQDEELIKLTDGNLSVYQDGYRITFFKEIRLDILKDGFYIDKSISKKQLTLQRTIIQDFLEKKIRIDHIESLLVRPERIRTPKVSKLDFKNPDLERTEKEQPDNNQVKAVKKAVGNENIFLIQGPPGTGKTTVIAEIIEQLVEKKEKILVAGQNHVAVDNVLEKLSKVPGLILLRAGKPDRIAKDLVRYNIDNLVEEYKADFKQFLKNQQLLAVHYMDLKARGMTHDEIVAPFTNMVREMGAKYEKLSEVYTRRHFILRDGLEQLTLVQISESINVMEDWTGSLQNEYEILLKPMLYNAVDVVFATCIGIKTDSVFKESTFKFDTVIIDEAGKAGIAESLVAMELGKKVILVGDQMQLPPYMDSSLIDESDPLSFPRSPFGSTFSKGEITHALKTSFFEFIIDRIKTGEFPAENLELLNYQHRMHPNIGTFVSESFYEGKVNMGSRTHLNRLEIPAPFNKEIIFFDTSNSANPFENKEGNSVKNTLEAVSIAELILPALFGYHIPEKNVAIIAPYKSQVAHIKNYIQSSDVCRLKNIDVSTLDSFQGKEYDIIIFSFTRSADLSRRSRNGETWQSTKVGFLDDARRLNVAFSRAKKKLILIGNAITLASPKSHYDGLFDYTALFNRLISLSKQNDIGNFVSISDYQGQASFANFIRALKPGDQLQGVVGAAAISPSGITYGKYIHTGSHRCIAPYNHQQQLLNRDVNKAQEGKTVMVTVVEIDARYKKITVKIIPESWAERPCRLQLDQTVRATVWQCFDFGVILKTEHGLTGLLHKKYFRGKPFPALRDQIEVVIIEINFQKQQIAFKI